MIKINVRYLLFLVLQTMYIIPEQLQESAKPMITKELHIVADISFLHEHDSKCFIEIDPIGTVVTRNDMDDNGNIILLESRNDAIILMPKPKDGIIHITVNFECNCYVTEYQIPYAQLAKLGNRIDLYEKKTELKNIETNKTELLHGKQIDKQLCTQATSFQKHSNLRSHKLARPNAIVEPRVARAGRWNQKTVATILHEYKDTRQILLALKREGYSHDTLTEAELRLPGKLDDKQIRYIMNNLPYESLTRVQ